MIDGWFVGNCIVKVDYEKCFFFKLEDSLLRILNDWGKVIKYICVGWFCVGLILVWKIVYFS